MWKQYLYSVAVVGLMFAGHASFAKDREEKILFTTGSELTERQTVEFSEKACQILRQKIVIARGAPADTECAPLLAGTDVAALLRQKKSSKRFTAHLQLIEGKDGSLKVRADDWLAKEKDLERETFQWTIKPRAKADQHSALTKLIRNFLFYVENKDGMKGANLRYALKESKRLTQDEKGNFIDTQTQQVVPLEEATRIFANESDEHRHYLRAALEIAVVLGVGDAMYWANQSSMQQDWIFKATLEEQKRKFSGAGYRFDDNDIVMNFGHALAGMLYYTAARSNNFTALQSLLVSFVGSAMWESMFEFPEVFSINDQVVTGLGGAIIGETRYQFGKVFMRGTANSLIHKILRKVFAGEREFHNWLDGFKPKAEEVDEDGYPLDTWHRFDLFGGFTTSTRDGQTGMGGVVGLDMSLANIGSYDKPGQVKTLYTDPVFADFIFKTALGTNGMTDVLFLTRTALAGYYKQEITVDAQERLNGYSFFVGPSSAVEFGMEGDNDMHAAVGVLGSSLKLTLFVKGVRIRMNLDLYGEFGMIRSYAIDDYKAQYGDADLKSVQRKQSYSYGLGYSPQGSVSVKVDKLELSAGFVHRFMDSIDKRDQEMERVDAGKNPNTQEKRTDLKASVSYSISKRTKLRYNYEHTLRSGELGDVTKKGRTTKHTGEVVYSF